MAFSNLITTSYGSWAVAQNAITSEGGEQSNTARIIDGSDSTAWGVSVGSTNHTRYCLLNATLTFNAANQYNFIDSFRARFKLYVSGAVNYRKFQVRILQNGVWSNVFYTTSNYGLATMTSTTGWANVEGVNIIAQAGHSSAGGTLQLWVYDVSAQGEVYAPTGLRYSDGTNEYDIMGNSSVSDKGLRVYDGSQVLGIPLIATDRVDAGGIRLYDGSTIKSVPVKQV